MPKLLPAIPTKDDFYRERSRPVTDWEAGLCEIAHRHQLPIPTITRFPDGENPVFALGDDQVIKLVPAFTQELVQHEIDFLSFISPHPHIPSSRLTGHGLFEDWIYLITTRVSGQLLQQAWPDIPLNQRLQLTQDCGRLLADLHTLPQRPSISGKTDWPAFCREAVAKWPERPSVTRLPKALQIDGPRYFKDHLAAITSPANVVLHGDLAPVNLLIKCDGGRWGISGMIDFGNAMHGNPWFDLTAMGVLLQPGDRIIVHRLIEGYVPGASQRMAEIRPWLQTNCLIHPLADQAGALSLIPAAAQCQTWDEVALLFWPD